MVGRRGWRVGSKRLLLAGVSALSIFGPGIPNASAQDAGLPAVTIEPPRQRQRPAPVLRPTRGPATAARPAPRRRATPAPVVAAPVAIPNIEPAPALAASDAARGPVNGYVATTSASATKTATPLNETPQAITVIGAKQIRDTGAETFDQALQYSPGVRGQTFGLDYRNDWFLLRGFPAQETGYFLDGLQLFSFGYSYFQLEPWGLERIEVLRGPSSSLYGGGSAGGIVNAISKLPTFTRFGVVEVGVNEFGNAYGAFDVGDVGGDRNEWSYRVVGLGRAGGTQIDFTDFNRGFIAPSITYRPDDATAITLFGQFTHTQTSGQNFLPYVGTVVPAPFGRISNRFFSSDPNIDRYQRDQAMAGYTLEHALDADTVFRQKFRYSFVDVGLRQLYGNGYDTPPTPTEAILARGNFVARDVASLVNVDNNLERRFTTGPLAHTGLLGLDYKHYNQRQNDGFATGSTIDILRPTYGPQPDVGSRYSVAHNEFDQLGFYAQDQVKFERLNLLFGGRYDMLNQNLDNRLNPANSGFKQTGRFTGRVGALYNLDYGFAPYVTFSTSFAPLVGTNSAGTLFRPEQGEQVEVGLKYQFPDLPISAAVAYFDLTRTNVPTTDPNSIFLQVQTGELNSRGVEVEVTANLAEGLNLVGAYTNYRLRVTRDTNPANIGLTPTNVPQEFASLFLDYTIPHGDLKGLGAGAGLRYVAPSFASGDNTSKVPEYVLGDMLIHYQFGAWRAAVGVTNFADRKYVASCALITACYYGERRRATGSLTYRW